MVDDSHGKDSPDDFYAQLEAARAQDAKDRPLDPDFAREEAKKLAETEERIIALIASRPRVFDQIEHLVFVDNSTHTTSKGIQSFTSNMKGIGRGIIELISYDKPDWFASLVGIETKNRLMIGFHTDLPTIEEARQMRNTDDLGTTFFFTRNGDYGKIVTLPTQLISGREVLRSDKEYGSHSVRGEMTAGDFELVGTTLQFFEERLAPPQTPTQAA